MAKRRAEAVACRAPCQLRAFPRAPPPPPPKRSRSDLERRESRGAVALWRENGGVKRKWTVVAEGGDEAGSGGKRLAEGTARREPEQRLPVVAGMATEAAALAGGDATAGQGGPEKPEDDVWHYNSFQFWKLPLPTIDLSDIQELEKGSITETRSSSNTSLSEMET